jgi:hypothetical protein
MHCIDALIAGIRGGENGLVKIYRRGTTTRVTCYTDFEGQDSFDQPDDGIRLDANGSTVVYVNASVNCLVYSSSGTLVRTFVAGTGAPAVEVINQSFTGTDYETGRSAASKPTSLDSVLTKWKTSAGAVDFQVLVGGVATDLDDAMTGLRGFFFNVKDAAYGAVGDGVTDDTQAIQTALDAAETAGSGIVILPYGTYLTSSVLTVARGVSVMGVGGRYGAVILNNGSSKVFTVEGTNNITASQFIANLWLKAESGSNVFIEIDNVNLTIENVYFDGLYGSHTGGCIKTTATPSRYELKVNRCRFTTVNTICIELLSASVAATLWINQCLIAGGSATTHLVKAQCETMISDSILDLGGSTQTCYGVYVYDETRITNCYFGGPFTGGTGYGIYVDSALSGAGKLLESNNRFESGLGTFYPYGVAGTSVLDDITLRSRSWLEQASNTTPITLNGLFYESEQITRTSGTTITINETQGPVGARKIITVLNNQTPNTMAITWGTNISGASQTVAANSSWSFEFISRLDYNGTVKWFQLAAAAAVAR